MPKVKDLDLSRDGTLELNIVQVSLHNSNTVRLHLTHVDKYLEKLAAHLHLAHTLQNREDVLR